MNYITKNGFLHLTVKGEYYIFVLEIGRFAISIAR